jgi:DNA-binding transcriptional MerR regulator
MSDTPTTYFQEWYRDNGDQLNKSRRERYRTDPEYREKVLEQNREARKRRRRQTLKERRKRQTASKARTSQSWKSVNVELKDSKGNPVVVKMFTIGAVAKALDCSVQALRLWEKKGIIPETEYRYSKGDRLYTQEQIETYREILLQQGRIGQNRVRTRPLPYVERWVAFPGERRKGKRVHADELHTLDEDVTEAILKNGRLVRKVKLFRIGVLAKAVGRTVVTLEQLEQKGAFPETPFRASEVGYRLYTAKMMEAVKTAFESRDGEIRGEEAWQDFHDEVYAAWKDLNVLGAEILD